MQRIKIHILLILGLLAPLFFYGSMQEKDGTFVIVENHFSNVGIAVRWTGEKIVYREGVRVLRSKNEKDWVVLNNDPIVPAAQALPEHPLKPKSETFFKGFLSASEDEFETGMLGVLTLIESIKDFNLALTLGIGFQDVTAEKGKKYFYRVEYLEKGEWNLLGESRKIKCSDYQKPQLPTNIRFTRKKRKTWVTWDVQEDTQFAYNLFWAKEGEDFELFKKEITANTMSQMKDQSLEIKTHKDTAYVFKVQVMGYFGQLSEQSDPVDVGVLDFDPPQKPIIKLSTQTKKQLVLVEWDPISDLDLDHYDVYRQLETVDESFVKMNENPIPKSMTQYEDKLTRHGVFNYYVVAVDASGNEGKSMPLYTEVQDIIPPVLPTDFFGRVDTGKVVLHWSRSTSSDLKGYQVYRAPYQENEKDLKFVQASKVIADTSFTELLAKNISRPFVYAIRAVDTLFNRSDFSQLIELKLPDVTPPVAPFIKGVSYTDTSLIISWTSNVEKDLAGYQIQRKCGKETNFSILDGELGKGALTFVDQILPGTQCHYELRALDQSGLISPPSNGIEVTMPVKFMEGEIVLEGQKFKESKKQFQFNWSWEALRNEKVVGNSVYQSFNQGKAVKQGSMNMETSWSGTLKKPGVYEFHVRAFGEQGTIVVSDTLKIIVPADNSEE